MKRGKPQMRIFLVALLSLNVFCYFVSAGELTKSETEGLFTYDSHGKKDPFGPSVIGTVEGKDSEILTGIRLEGIIWDKDNPVAIINDKVMGIGDIVNGARIVSITVNEVVFDIGGKHIKLKLQFVEEGAI